MEVISERGEAFNHDGLSQQREKRVLRFKVRLRRQSTPEPIAVFNIRFNQMSRDGDLVGCTRKQNGVRDSEIVSINLSFARVGALSAFLGARVDYLYVA